MQQIVTFLCSAEVKAPRTKDTESALGLEFISGPCLWNSLPTSSHQLGTELGKLNLVLKNYLLLTRYQWHHIRYGTMATNVFGHST